MWKTSKIDFVKGNHPLIMAHRGDSANIPENTMRAFQDAYDLNVDVIETDVRMTKDFHFVFNHDAKVDRMTNGHGKVITFTLEEIKKLDAGYGFQADDGSYPFRGKGLKIWTIDEIIPKFPDVKFNIDIKDTHKKAPKLLAEKIVQLGIQDRVQIGSFHQKQIDTFRKYSDVPTSAGPMETIKFWKKSHEWIKKNKKRLDETIELDQKEIFGKKLNYVSLTVPEGAGPLKIITPETIKFAHKIGIAAYVWTINEPKDIERLLKWGVDGIFTDKPSLMIEILQNTKFNGLI